MSLVVENLDTLMKSTFDRLKNGIYFDVNMKSYHPDFLQKLLKYFQEKEKYEECVIILEIIKNRFNHDNVTNYRNF